MLRDKHIEFQKVFTHANVRFSSQIKMFALIILLFIQTNW